MANITSLLLANLNRPALQVEPFILRDTFALAATIADNGDTVQLYQLPRAGLIVNAWLKLSATLGASATMQLQVGTVASRSNVTIATTAGGASTVSNATLGMIPFAADDYIFLLSGGADTSAAASAIVELHLKYT